MGYPRLSKLGSYTMLAVFTLCQIWVGSGKKIDPYFSIGKVVPKSIRIPGTGEDAAIERSDGKKAFVATGFFSTVGAVSGSGGLKCTDEQFKTDFPEPSCQDCDENCAVHCIRAIGCPLCIKGFFTSRLDAQLPKACRPCLVPDCEKCQDDVYDSWPEICVACMAGFELSEAGKACSRIPAPKDAPQTEGIEDLEVSDQNVGPDAGTQIPKGSSSTESGMRPCPEGSIFKLLNKSCVPCDENCLANQCVDEEGCLQCSPGFHTSRVDLFWPRNCRPCTIDACKSCKNDIFDESASECEECNDGFVVSEDAQSCIAEPKEESVNQEEKHDAPKETEVNEEHPSTSEKEFPNSEGLKAGGKMLTPQQNEPLGVLEQSVPGCPEGSFMKAIDDTCMECDENCAPDQCQDNTGCNECLPGFFRSREDPEWPFRCIDCDSRIPNCQECKDGIFDSEPIECLACEQGFELSIDGAQCTQSN